MWPRWAWGVRPTASVGGSCVASALPGAEQEQRLTLEEIFLSIVGGSSHQEQELTWLT